MLFTFDLLVSNPGAALRIFKASVNSAFVTPLMSDGFLALQANDPESARVHFSEAAAQGCGTGDFWLVLTDASNESRLARLLELYQAGAKSRNADCVALFAAMHASRPKPNTSIVRLMLAHSIDAGSLIGLFNASMLVDCTTRMIVMRYIADHAAIALNFHDFLLVKAYILYATAYYELTTFGFGDKLRRELGYACHGLYRFFAKIYRLLGNDAFSRDALYKAWLYDKCSKSMLDYVGDDVVALRKLNTPEATQVADTLEAYPVGYIGYSNRQFNIVLAGDVAACELSAFNVTHVEARSMPSPLVEYVWSSDTVTSIEIVKCDGFFNESLLELNSLKRVRLKKLEFTPDALDLAFALLCCGVKRVELDRCTTCPMKPSGNTVDAFRKHCEQFFFVQDATTAECRAYLGRCSFNRAAVLSTRGRQHVARATKRKMIGSIKL
jgi:hypothetical protein